MATRIPNLVRRCHQYRYQLHWSSSLSRVPSSPSLSSIAATAAARASVGVRSISNTINTGIITKCWPSYHHHAWELHSISSVSSSGSISRSLATNDTNVNDPVHTNSVHIDSNTSNTNVNMSKQPSKPFEKVASVASLDPSVPISSSGTSSEGSPRQSKQSQAVSEPCSSSGEHEPQPSQGTSQVASSSSRTGGGVHDKAQSVPKVPTSAISGTWSTLGAPAHTDVTDSSRGDDNIGITQPRPPADFDTISGSRSKEMREKFGDNSKPSQQQQQQQQAQQQSGAAGAPSSGPLRGSEKQESTASSFSGSPSSSGAHESIWQTSYPISSAHLPSFGPLTENTTTEVVIVGAGLAGLTTAYELTRRGRDVVIVDGMTSIGGGETGRTTGHLASYLDDGVVELMRVHGTENTRLIIDSHAHAIDTIETIVKRHNINCDFKRVDGFLFSKNDKVKEGEAIDDDIKAEWEAIQQCKVFAQAELIDRVPSILGGNTGNAIRFPNQAQFHPTKYLYALTKILTDQKSESSGKGSKAATSAAAASGSEGKIGSCRIHCSTHIIKYEGGNRAWVETADHHRVAANYVVMATNVPLQIINLIDSVKPLRSYVIGASIPIKYAEENNALWWDTDEPYHYVRIMMNDAAKSDDDRYMIIIGGEDHVVGRGNGRSANERYRALEEWARARWPMMNAVTSRWSGQVEEPVDLIAYIGVNPHDHDNVYICTGDSGEGLTHGTIAGSLITDLITKTKNKYSKLYNPARHMSLSAAPGYLEHNVVTQFQFGRWLAPSDINDIEDLRPCHGAVMREGLAPVACYRDKDGHVMKMSAICPHMKGIVRWNNDEQSWDCPVHGSRFTATGKVVHGPAKEGLTPISEST